MARQGEEHARGISILSKERVPRVDQPLQLTAGAAGVSLAAGLGGSITSFTWHGVPVMRPTPADAETLRNVRATSCFPLVPYSNRIRDARLSFADRAHALERNLGEHPHAIHGVGWQRAWTIVSHGSAHAAMTIAHDPARDGVSSWPWPFEATQTLDLAATPDRASLTMTLTLRNAGGEPFPFGLGWHPYFPRDASTTLRFDADAVWLTDATLIPTERTAATDAWSFADARPLGTQTIDNVFCGFTGRAVLDSRDTRLTTTIEADSSCRWLIVYAPADRDFVAIEPVTHETDAFNRSALGASDTGTRVLPPGEAFSCTMRVSVASR